MIFDVIKTFKFGNSVSLIKKLSYQVYRLSFGLVLISAQGLARENTTCLATKHSKE
jgi:hypothetical protein